MGGKLHMRLLIAKMLIPNIYPAVVSNKNISMKAKADNSKSNIEKCAGPIFMGGKHYLHTNHQYLPTQQSSFILASQ